MSVLPYLRRTRRSPLAKTRHIIREPDRRHRGEVEVAERSEPCDDDFRDRGTVAETTSDKAKVPNHRSNPVPRIGVSL